jgi:hypothetical protein
LRPLCLCLVNEFVYLRYTPFIIGLALNNTSGPLILAECGGHFVSWLRPFGFDKRDAMNILEMEIHVLTRFESVLTLWERKMWEGTIWTSERIRASWYPLFGCHGAVGR